MNAVYLSNGMMFVRENLKCNIVCLYLVGEGSMVPVKQVWKFEYFFIDTDNKFSHFSYAQLFSRDNLKSECCC